MFDLNVILVQDSRDRIRQILERYEEECKIWNPLAVYSQLHMFLKGTEIFSHSLECDDRIVNRSTQKFGTGCTFLTSVVEITIQVSECLLAPFAPPEHLDYLKPRIILV
jgi:hypothetical protein